ncbi:MAG: [Clostridia bacterium]|nr:[FeFe] hydrogenase H-cluster maturation GTPase HydF [Clostridia bacterium]
SDVKGTTTDPVRKAMELLPLGPVVIIDTPGLDDEGTLGALRVEKAKGILAEADVAVLVVDAVLGLSREDRDLLELLDERKIPHLTVMNKRDLLDRIPENADGVLYVSAKDGGGIRELKEALAGISKPGGEERHVIADLLEPGDTVVLVIPIDAAAPKGRLILPQQQTIRDILEAGCAAVCCRDTELAGTLASLAHPPKMVVTDSQAFGRVSKIVPQDVALTSFSILFARYKGDLAELVKGAAALSALRDGDVVLVSEGCSHHRQCGDIGTEKIPAWVRSFTGVNPDFRFTSGGEFPEVPDARLVIHCGGCMLNEREMKSRIGRAVSAGVPIVNYGVAIAHMHGILKRSLEPFPEVLRLLEN